MVYKQENKTRPKLSKCLSVNIDDVEYCEGRKLSLSKVLRKAILDMRNYGNTETGQSPMDLAIKIRKLTILLEGMRDFMQEKGIIDEYLTSLEGKNGCVWMSRV